MTDAADALSSAEAPSALRDAVWRALDTVIDPELDEPITGLDFVESYTVSEEGVATGKARTWEAESPAPCPAFWPCAAGPHPVATVASRSATALVQTAERTPGN